jgi:hypothetical protein
MRRGNGQNCMTLHDAFGSENRYFLSFQESEPDAEISVIYLVIYL